MEFVFSDEQSELRSMARGFLRDTSPEAQVRRLMETPEGFDASVWAQLAELGLTGLGIPERYGGAGRGAVEVGIVMEEAGAALLCAPYLSTVVLATETLLAAGDEAALKTYLPGIAEGTLRATLATDGALKARQVSGEWLLDGTADRVLDGLSAGMVLAVAGTPEGHRLFAVDTGAAGVSRTALATMDATRKQAALTLTRTPARPVGEAGLPDRILGHVLAVASTCLAAEQVGGAQRTLDMAVGYAKLRVQFGRPIGSFQAIKHKCADLFLRVEAARSAAYHALWSAAEGSPEFAAAAHIAGAYCSEAYYHCAEENILIHGGIGYTWEHPAHLYFKRAAADRVLFGDPDHHRAALADGIPMTMA
ncbi:acyl-CoA dehydrogenase family protein [Actinomadura sp. SCN-SB]|uniref:acyl-CoA dehydrogenase family protein n=1 Tax=Actinomadura sp. SCN-SB TaxID=3373092 RepID=UPI003751F678